MSSISLSTCLVYLVPILTISRPVYNKPLDSILAFSDLTSGRRACVTVHGGAAGGFHGGDLAPGHHVGGWVGVVLGGRGGGDIMEERLKNATL